MKPGFWVSTVLTMIGVCGCRAAEPFRLGAGPDAGGIFIMPGSGGTGGAGGSGGFAPGGSGGDIGTGGSGGDDDAGSGSPDTGGGGGSGGASMDSGTPIDTGATDTGGARDAGGVRDTMPAELRPVGPTTLFNCYVIARYTPGTAYKGGDRVFQIADLRVYQCRPWPYEGWCPLPTYQPGDESTGYWRDAWVQLGYCE